MSKDCHPAGLVAKELGDFLQHYKRETELFTVFREESGMIPRWGLKGTSQPNKSQEGLKQRHS